MKRVVLMGHSRDRLLYRTLMDGIKEMLFVVNVEGNGDFTYEFVNQEAMVRTGLGEEDYGQPIRLVQEEELASFLYEQYSKTVKEKEQIIYEDSYISSSGERYYSKTRLTPLFDDKNQCTHIVGLVQDVTEMKWAEREVYESKERLNESKQRFQSLFDHNIDGIFFLNLHGEILFGNDATSTILGIQAEEIVGTDFFSILEGSQLDEVRKVFSLAQKGESKSVRLTVNHKIELLTVFIPIVIDQNISGMYWILKDITKELANMKKYMESEHRFRIIAENAQDLITLLDVEGVMIYVSPSYKTVLGFDENYFVGKPFIQNVDESDQLQLAQLITSSIQEAKPWKMQLKQKHKLKEFIWTELQGTPVFDEANHFIHTVVITRDITLHKNYESKLQHFAYHDSLTNLPNRRLLKDKITEELASNRNGMSVLILDVDHFKAINDELGHDIGDEVIIEFGKRLKKCTKERDLVARLGGDEFVVLLPHINKIDELEMVAEKILESIREPWNINQIELVVTTSIGMTIVTLPNATPAIILKAADQALYKAKALGRNTSEVVFL